MPPNTNDEDKQALAEYRALQIHNMEALTKTVRELCDRMLRVEIQMQAAAKGGSYIGAVVGSVITAALIGVITKVLK